MYNKNK